MCKSHLRFVVYLDEAGCDRLINARVSCVYISLDIISRNCAEANRSIGGSHWTLRRAGSEPGSTDVLPPALSIHIHLRLFTFLHCVRHTRACVHAVGHCVCDMYVCVRTHTDIASHCRRLVVAFVFEVSQRSGSRVTSAFRCAR